MCDVVVVVERVSYEFYCSFIFIISLLGVKCVIERAR